MKKFLRFCFIFIFVLGILHILNSQFHFVGSFQKKEETAEFTVQKKLQTFHPILEDQRIVAVVLAYNCVETVTRNLDSLLNQTYSHGHLIFIDNGSTDGTFEKIKQHLEEKGKGDRIELVHHEKKRPDMKVLYDVIHGLDPHDVVVLLRGKDWLTHENVFDHLNCAYANPDVWMTYSRSVSYPDYQEVRGQALPDMGFLEKRLRKDDTLSLPGLKSFYAGFFQEIKLQAFLFKGKFIEEQSEPAIIFPLVEMGPEHVLFLDEIAYVSNDSQTEHDHKTHLRQLMAVESYLRSLAPCHHLSAVNLTPATSSFHRYKGDVVIFSEDSPLHLYACIESIYGKVRDTNSIYVLYEANDPEFERAYLNLKSEFPMIHFLDVCDYPGNDFDTLLSRVLSNQRHGSPYVLLTDDHIVFDEKLRLHECIQAMEKVHCDHFFLCLDETFKEGETLPEALPLGEGVYAWQVGENWECPRFCVNLCRKSLFDGEAGKIEDFATFKKLWKKQVLPHYVGLFYEERKTLPIQGNQETTATQRKEWNSKFIEGFKIDLPSLVCEMEEVEKGDYPLIKREKKPRRQL